MVFGLHLLRTQHPVCVLSFRPGDRRVLSTDILFDVGRPLNPAVDLGQIEGAFVMGLGMCLSGRAGGVMRRAVGRFVLEAQVAGLTCAFWAHPL
jgi:hypothetical protein